MKILLEISYLGWGYCGYQIQENGLTITEVMQNAIEKLYGVRYDIVGCSRTDSKVHANAYFLTYQPEREIPCERLPRALNGFLPRDIVVKEANMVEETFHPRYDCIGKEYVYKIWNQQVPSPFYYDRSLFYPYPIDLERLNEGAKLFIGRKDFKSFCSMKSQVEDTVREIYHCYGVKKEEFIEIYVYGNGFLHNMVRIIVGTLLEVGNGRLTLEQVEKIIQEKDRRIAPKTAEPQGLYLNRVIYEDTKE